MKDYENLVLLVIYVYGRMEIVMEVKCDMLS